MTPQTDLMPTTVGKDRMRVTIERVNARVTEMFDGDVPPDMRPPTFGAWMAQQQHRTDPIGELVNEMIGFGYELPDWYGGWLEILQENGVAVEGSELDAALLEYWMTHHGADFAPGIGQYDSWPELYRAAFTHGVSDTLEFLLELEGDDFYDSSTHAVLLGLVRRLRDIEFDIVRREVVG